MKPSLETYCLNTLDGSLEVVPVAKGWAIWSSRTGGCIAYYPTRSDAAKAIARITKTERI